MIDDGKGGSVGHPEKRKTLMYLLSELSDPALQMKLWVNHEDAPNIHGIDEVFHFFFDDSELAREPKSEIGWILEDEGEAEQIATLCIALEAMLNRLGDRESIAFLNDAQWASVVRLAKNALETVTKPSQ